MVRARRVVVGDAEVAACVAVTDGLIAAVTPYDRVPSVPTVVTLGDDEVLLPGLVDTHVHVNEPGRTEWEGFATATRAAAAGGVTTILDMPLNSVPATTTRSPPWSSSARSPRGRRSSTWGSGAGRCPTTSPTWRALHEAGVFGFKCFLLDSGVAEFPHLPPDAFAAAMAETARIGALMIVHAEDGSLLDDSALDGEHYAGFLASRPRAAEEAAIALVLEQARATGGRTHVVHLSDADAVPMLRSARAEGVDVSVETCPHYLTFDAEHVPDGATELKCCPPIREADNREALWAALAAGDVDLVVSDHSPCTASLKASPDFGAGLGRDLLGAARPAGRVVRGPGARTLARRRGAVDGDGPGRPGRARPTADGSPSAPRPTWCGSPRTRRSPWTWPGSSTATPCRRTPAGRSWARYGRPGCAAYRWTTMCPEDSCW